MFKRLENGGNITHSVNNKHDIAMRIVTVIPVFVYFLFFVGHTYSEAYLKRLGIPVSLINYDFLDYVYFGAHIDNLLITLAFTFAFFLLISYLQRSVSTGETYQRVALIISMFYLVWYTIALATTAIVTIFNPHVIIHPAMTMAVIISGMISLGFAILIFTEKGLIQRIKRGKYLSPLFLSAVILTLICFPYMFTSAWGTFKASGFPYRDLNLSSNTLIEMTTDYPLIEEIRWESKDNNSYVNADRLFLVLKNEEHLFVKTNLRELETYIIRSEELISYKVIPIE